MTIGTLLASTAVCALVVIVTSPALAQVAGAKERDQARDAANIAALSSAVLTYTSDNDDQFPVASHNIQGGVCSPVDPLFCGLRSMWSRHVFPYLSSWKIMRANDEYQGKDGRVEYFNVSYGYNYGYLSTLCLQNDGGFSQNVLGCAPSDPGSPNSTQWFESVSRDEVVTPAKTILLTDYAGRAFSSELIMGSLVNPPPAWNIDRYTYGPNELGWGKNCSNWFSTQNARVRNNRFNTWDGFAPRYLGRANVAFVDGHVAQLSPAEAATGTNFDPSQSCTLTVVTNPTAYKWDPRN